MRIYLDVDDTLLGFRQHCIANGVPKWEGSWYTTDRAGWTPAQCDIQDRTNDLMRSEDFWMTMPVVPGAHELIAAASFHGPVSLLTALPASLMDEPGVIGMVARAKVARAWQALHVPPERVLCVPRRDKVRFAFDHFDSVSNILIDDAASTCEDWTTAGGVAFHLLHVEDGLDEAINFIKCL